MVLQPLRKPACVSQRRVSERSVSSRGANTPAFLSGVSPDLCAPWLSPCLADGGFIPAIPSPIVKLQKQWGMQAEGPAGTSRWAARGGHPVFSETATPRSSSHAVATPSIAAMLPRARPLTA